MKLSYLLPFVLLSAILIYGFSAKTRSAGADKPDPAVLIKADSLFSEFSVKNGFARAFITYADTNAIKMISDKFPLVGKQAIAEQYHKVSPNNHNRLSWKPVRAEIAGSGDLGYTFGNYEFRVKLTSGGDTILYGNYVSIWKQQQNGSWKYVLDGGNPTPKP